MDGPITRPPGSGDASPKLGLLCGTLLSLLCM